MEEVGAKYVAGKKNHFDSFGGRVHSCPTETNGTETDGPPDETFVEESWKYQVHPLLQLINDDEDLKALADELQKILHDYDVHTLKLRKLMVRYHPFQFYCLCYRPRMKIPFFHHWKHIALGTKRRPTLST